jgi:hypothetical protein
MSATFNFVNITTVPPTYSWDMGNPITDFYDDLIDNKTHVLKRVSNNNFEKREYYGYAPYVSLTLSSNVGFLNVSAVEVKRVFDFGDYYNSDNNIVTVATAADVNISHVYIMPGLYSIKMTKTQFVELEISTGNTFIQPIDLGERVPLFWQWRNYQCENNIINQSVLARWADTSFQQRGQLTWEDTKGPCVDVPINQISLSALEETVEKPFFVRVFEIPPEAHLFVEQPERQNRISPLTVRLSPRFVKCGSFPIDRIDWNFGDGSPIVSQKRWDLNTKFPFVYSDVYALDWKDPRNYDVIYTYKKTANATFSFYPSITAYASSTHTSNCAAAVVGPIVPQKLSTLDFKITQNELTEKGSVYLGKISNFIALWNSKS